MENIIFEEIPPRVSNPLSKNEIFNNAPVNLRPISLSQSQPVTPISRILSPAPLKKTSVSRIGSSVARELFSACSDQIETDNSNLRSATESPSSFVKTKILCLKGESDSSSWSSESGCSHVLDAEFESPKKQVVGSTFNQDQIFDEIPCRASNELFGKQSLFGHKSLLAIPSRRGGNKILEFY